ncbi:MAG: hypothetical protein AAGA17_02300 [Actinomycetota bacterium]
MPQSIVRTIVPMIVGFVLSLPIVSSLDIDQAALETVVSGVVVSVYYVVVRFLEERHAVFGWLLGLARTPTY